LNTDHTASGFTSKIGDKYIDVLYDANDQHTPYQACVWSEGRITERIFHPHLEQTATFCKQHGLPIVSNNAQIRIELRSYGVSALPPAEQVIGNNR
jgi:hypothetical protein